MYNDKKIRAVEYISLITLMVALHIGAYKLSEYAELALYITYIVNIFFATVLQLRLSYSSVRKRYADLVEGSLSETLATDIKVKYHLLYIISTVTIIFFYKYVLQDGDLVNLKFISFIIHVLIGKTIKDVNNRYDEVSKVNDEDKKE